MNSQRKRKYPRLPEFLARIAMATGIGYLPAAYTVSRWLTRRTPRRPQLNPAHFGLGWERIECQTPDRIRLVGWLIEPDCPRATVVLFHGMRHNRERVLNRIQLLALNGYRCLAFDHRAHGESGGKRTSFGYHESNDVAAILQMVQKRWPDQPRAALGVSMGAAALCFAAQSGGWDAYILESCYDDISSAFTSRLRNGYPDWYQRLSHTVVWVTERRLGVRLAEVSPIKYIGQLGPSPVLILTGTEDQHAPPEGAQRLYERCLGPRELYLVPHATHRDVFEMGGPHYCRRVLDFLSQNLAA